MSLEGLNLASRWSSTSNKEIIDWHKKTIDRVKRAMFFLGRKYSVFTSDDTFIWCFNCGRK